MKTSNFPITLHVIAVYGVIAAALCGTAQAQMRFVEVSDAVGIQPFQMQAGIGGGVAAADYDNDNDIDLFVPNGGGQPNQLYRNDGAGHFEEIGVEAGVAGSGSQRTALWVDYNGDGRLDLVVAGDCRGQDDTCLPWVYVYRQNEQNTFDDVTDETGIVNPFGLASDPGEDAVFFGISAGDINNDGYLELVFSTILGTSRLLLNNGDGTFSDISASSNVGPTESNTHQHIMHDFNGDGWMDMHAAVDFSQDRLFINQHDNTFLDIAASAGVNNFGNDMGIALGDYDNDEDLDMYVTNINNNVFYRNDSSGGTVSFLEQADTLGMSDTDWGWGCTFLDGDNDGLLDLAVTNGRDNFVFRDDPSVFFYNNGGDPVTFSDRSDAVGFNDTFFGSSLIAIDYNRDGFLDMVQTTHEEEGIVNSQLRVLRNEPNDSSALNNYVVIKPRMEGANHYAIGATVHVQIGEVSLMRLISAGTSFIGQEPAEAHFGLGGAETIDQIRIEWPGGGSSQFQDITANRIYTVRADSIEVNLRNLDLDGDGLDEEEEVLVYGTDPTLFDTDGDGVSDGAEITFGSDPLDLNDTVSLPSLRGVGQGLLCLVLAVTAFMLARASRYIGFTPYTLKAPMGERHEEDLEP